MKEEQALQEDTPGQNGDLPPGQLIEQTALDRNLIEHVHGKLDAEQMIWLCRCYPPDHSCLHQAVFCPADGDFWFANAASPDESETPGAQNQPFLPFNLNAILEFDAVEENRG